MLPGWRGLPYAVALPSGNPTDRTADAMQEPVTPAEPRIALVPNAEGAAEFPRVPGYRFQKRIGQGGMASVYLATQESLDRPVSIKVMERDALLDEISKQRFEHEARTIAKLTHPSIVNIYEVGRTADGRMYYIMPYLANGDLSQRDLRKDEPRIIDILRALLSALDYAHARGIVHRDVKEENVLFDVADRPLLTDFGIALSKRDQSRITTAGLAVGSSGYMAPEQARGDAVDGRADLYSLGVLAYQLLTGRLPYQSPDALALALMHAQKPIPRLPTTKSHWQGFIDQAMAKSPDQRFHNAAAMVQSLERIARRSGDRLSSRMLRHFDRTAGGNLWRNLGVLALVGVLLVAFGLYSGRVRSPAIGASAGSAQQDPNAAAATASAPTAAAQASAAADVRDVAGAKPSTHIAISPNASLTALAAVPPVPAPLPSVAHALNAGIIKMAPASPSISPDTAVLDAAHDALAHANLTSPADRNALDLTRMAWKLSPATPDTQRLVSDVLIALSKQQALAIGQHHDPRVIDYQQKVQQLADATIGRTTPLWHTLHTTAASALDKRVQAESIASDKAALTRSEALAKQLDLTDTYTHSVAAAQQAARQTASAAAAAAIDVGPGFVLLHAASRAHPAVALARTEVTRHEYAQFVNATRRPASACTNAQAVADASARKNWTEPGFVQTSEQPVVCVSWNDANAYAQWLSTHTGQRYRLANVADLHEVGTTATDAAITGSFSGWLQNCAAGCQRHLVAGHAWRGRGDAPAARAADHGFDDVGFRVVREIGGTH